MNTQPQDDAPIPTRRPRPPAPDFLPAWELTALAIGDLIVFIIFAAIGQANHSIEPVGGPVLGAINTAVPFEVAWLIVAVLAGAFSGKALYPLRRVFIRTLLPALIAGPIGAVFWAATRGGPELRRFSLDPMFVLVATGTTAVMLVIWRVVWSRVRRLWWPELP